MVSRLVGAARSEANHLESIGPLVDEHGPMGCVEALRGAASKVEAALERLREAE